MLLFSHLRMNESYIIELRISLSLVFHGQRLRFVSNRNKCSTLLDI